MYSSSRGFRTDPGSHCYSRVISRIAAQRDRELREDEEKDALEERLKKEGRYRGEEHYVEESTSDRKDDYPLGEEGVAEAQNVEHIAGQHPAGPASSSASCSSAFHMDCTTDEKGKD